MTMSHLRKLSFFGMLVFYTILQARLVYKAADDDWAILSPCNAAALPSYQVCGGLSDQLLGHAIHISSNIRSNEEVRIPDVFLVDGTQHNGGFVFPDRQNSVPLGAVLDLRSLLRLADEHGVNACFVPYHNVLSLYGEREPACGWMDQMDQLRDDGLVLEVMRSMKPSVGLARIIEDAVASIERILKESKLSLSDGVCLHHKNGPHWKDYCQALVGKNCLESEGRPIKELVHDRIPRKYNSSWVYYIGDEKIDRVLMKEFQQSGRAVVSRTTHRLVSSGLGTHTELGRASKKREVLSAIDFFLCNRLRSFIGNSVSKYSALQIARRGGANASWYNSGPIPLALVLGVYHLPIVYTYTELSQGTGKCLLKASILSARRVFGFGVEIHIIYHGEKDTAFLKWLEGHHIIVHHHMPTWSEMIEQMRLKSVAANSMSHLVPHSGNFFGTWQRIDLPLYINAEYAIFLDSDTIIHDHFSMADFGVEITRGIAYSGEWETEHKVPLNAGVAVLNIPHLRKTYEQFMGFIEYHAEKGIEFKGGPADQGAYRDFYGKATQGEMLALTYLDPIFNFKPYYQSAYAFQRRKIVHFHGLKPHDILRYWMGDGGASAFRPVLRPLLDKVALSPGPVCQTLKEFGSALKADTTNMRSYCEKSGLDTSCVQFFMTITHVPDVDCATVGRVVREVGNDTWWQPYMALFVKN